MKLHLSLILLLAGFFSIPTGTAMAQNTQTNISKHHAHLQGPYADGMAVTKDCLKCHRKQADEVLQSAHWLWQGPSPHVQGHEHRTDLGKRALINNF
jgi:hypothetical protein